jgi:hypothetical protein
LRTIGLSFGKYLFQRTNGYGRVMAANLGIKKKDRREVLQGLSRLLADSCTL